MPNKLRRANAIAAAEVYAPKPNGSAVTYGLVAAALLVAALLAGAFFKTDITSNPLALLGLTILAFVAGAAKRPVVEFPEPLWTEWDDPTSFSEALNLHMRRHGDSVRHLFHAIARDDRATNHRTMMRWFNGDLVPRSIQSLEVLVRIERRYRLPAG